MSLEQKKYNKLLNKDKIQLAVFRSSTILANNILPVNRALAIKRRIEFASRIVCNKPCFILLGATCFCGHSVADIVSQR